MDFVLGAIAGFLSLYLAFTNTLASGIESVFLAEEDYPSSSTISTNQTTKITRTASNYEKGGLIPDILINNAAYQKANSLDAVDDLVSGAAIEEALVNIYCTYKTEKEIKATTGTGWFIDRDGIVITNAHVAQLLLLADIYGEDGECVLRTGSPATSTYTADLLYIPPAWLREYAPVIVSSSTPKGTGERDYALLYINKALNNKPMPRHFPALKINTDLINTGAVDKTVTIGGYPAHNLKFEENETIIEQVVATTTITELMTFGTNYADLFSLSGSSVGKQGASGGPVLNNRGEVVGMITTRGDDKLFGAGSLRAVTLSYIDRTMLEETGVSLRKNLSGDLPFRAQLYKDTMIPFLKKYLEWELE